VANRPALGKGLASLFPGAQGLTPPPAPSAQAANGVGAIAAGSAEFNSGRIPGLTFAAIEDIVANPYQPRREFDETTLKELSHSIQTNGVIQPLVVRKGTYGYQLIAGERRLRAAKMAGLKQVPIVVRKSTDREALEIALIENVQRHDLNCIDEGLAYLQLMQDFNLTQEEVAERTGKDRSTIANFVRLLKLPEAIIDDLKKGTLSFGHGKVLLGLEDQDQRLLARKKIVEQKLSVRNAEALIDSMKKGAQGSAHTATSSEPLTPIQSRMKNLALEITRSVGVKAEIKGSERKGKLILQYSTREELDRLISFMQNQR
jgi:ParB family chromosome partitioning protein